MNPSLLPPHRSLTLARCGLALLTVGVLLPAGWWLLDQGFWLLAGPALAFQLAASACGVAGWRHRSGKVAAVVGGVLFVLSTAFIALVLLIVESARRGAPM